MADKFTPDMAMIRDLSAMRIPEGLITYTRRAVIEQAWGSIVVGEGEAKRFILLAEISSALDIPHGVVAQHVAKPLTPWVTRAEIQTIAEHVANVAPLASTWSHLVRTLALGCLLAAIPDDPPPVPEPIAPDGPTPVTVAAAIGEALIEASRKTA